MREDLFVVNSKTLNSASFQLGTFQIELPYSEEFQVIYGDETLADFIEKIKTNIAFFCTQTELDKLTTLNKYIIPKLNSLKITRDMIENPKFPIEIQNWSDLKQWLWKPKLFFRLLLGSDSKYADWFEFISDSIEKKDDEYWDAQVAYCESLETNKNFN